MRLFHKIRIIKHNKLISFLILMISVDYEKTKYFSIFTDNDGFISIIATQNLWTSGNTELPQLDLR